MASAKLIEFLASGLEDTNGNPLSGYQVITYASDGTTPKVVWEDRGKTLPSSSGKSSFSLDTTGRADVFGDGVYVVKIWTDTADTGVDSPYKTFPADDFSVDSTTVQTLVVQTADTYADLKTKDTTLGLVYVKGRTADADGGEGDFLFDSSNLSTEVTADTIGGKYIAPSGEDGSSGAWVRQYHDNLFYIDWFGTDVASFNVAKAVAATGETLTWRNKAYSYSSGITIPLGLNTRFEGSGYISYTGTGTAITLTAGQFNTYDIAVVQSSINWTAGQIGCEIKDHVDCVFNIKKIESFAIGLYPHCGVGEFIAYNKIYLDWLVNNERAIKILVDSGSGSINKNEYYGGRFACGDSSVQNSDRWGIDIEGLGDNAIGSQLFYSPSFEIESASTGTGDARAFTCKAKSINNHVIDGRMESGTISTKVNYALSCSSTARGNTFLGEIGTGTGNPKNISSFLEDTSDHVGSNRIIWRNLNIPKLRNVFDPDMFSRAYLTNAGTESVVVSGFNSLATSGGAVAEVSTTIYLYKNTLGLRDGFAVGRFVDTTTVKDFWLNYNGNIAQDDGNIYVIQCYDEDGGILYDAVNFPLNADVVDTNDYTELVNTANYGTAYTLTALKSSARIYFGSTVKYAFIGLSNNQSGKQTYVNTFNVMVKNDDPIPNSWATYNEAQRWVDRGAALYSTVSPVGGFIRRGQKFDHTLAAIGSPAGWQCVIAPVTDTTATLAAGGTNLTVTSISGIDSGFIIGVELDNGVFHWSTVNGAPSGSTVVLSDAIPVGRSVATGAIVHTFKMGAMANLA